MTFMVQTPLIAPDATSIPFSSAVQEDSLTEPILSNQSMKKLVNHPLFQFRITLSCSTNPTALNTLLQVKKLRNLFDNDICRFEVLQETVGKMEIYFKQENGHVGHVLLASLKHFKREMRILWLKEQKTRCPNNMSGIAAGIRELNRKLSTTSESHHVQKYLEIVDTSCGICYNKDPQGSSMLTCKTCNISVHSECYCIEQTWRRSQSWQCFACQTIESGNKELVCQACLQKGGAMMPTMTAGNWVHASCAMFLPELYFAADKEIIYGSIPQVCGVELLKERRKLRCCLCKKISGGACAQCDYKRCTTAYHVQCALQNGIRFLYDAFKARHVSACSQHQLKTMSITEKNIAADQSLRKAFLSHEAFRICERLVKRHPRMVKKSTPFDHQTLCPSFAAFNSSGSVVHDLSHADCTMISIPSFPVGMEWITGSITLDGHTISTLHLSAARSRNSIVVKAVEKGILKDRDFFFAMNDTMHLDMDISKFHARSNDRCNLFPNRCWFKRLSALESCGIRVEFDTKKHHECSTVDEKCATLPKTKIIKAPTFKPQLDTPIAATATKKRRLLPTYSDDDMRNLQWPWSSYLRSDGKLAMKMVWTSIDTFYFSINQKELYECGKRINSLLGLCVFPCDVLQLWQDYFGNILPVNKVLELPPLLSESVEASTTLQSGASLAPKSAEIASQAFDDSFVEQLRDQNDDSFAERSHIPIGVTVNVAKRTWPGINKLGGSGRIVAAHLERHVPNKGGSVYSYDIAYILGGREKRVARKYITEGGQTLIAGDTERHSEHDCPSTNNEKPIRRKSALSMQRSSRRRVFLSDSSDSEDASPVPQSKRRKVDHESNTNDQIAGNGTLPSCHRIQIAFALDPKREVYPNMLLQSCHPPLDNGPIQAMTSFSFSLSNKEVMLEKGNIKARDLAMRYYYDNSIQHHAVLIDPYHVYEQRKTDCEDDITEQLKAKQEELSHELLRLQPTLQHLHSAIDSLLASTAGTDEELKAQQCLILLKSANGLTADTMRSPNGEEDEEEDTSFGGVFVNRLSHESNDTCIICGLSGGDLAATLENDYVHPQCVIYTPETYFRDGRVYGIEQIPVKDRLALVCSICQGRRGLSKLQCAFPKCTLAFHIGCALIHGLLIREPLYIGWCPKHLSTSGMMQEVERPKHLLSTKWSAIPDKDLRDTDTPMQPEMKKTEGVASKDQEKRVDSLVIHKRQKRQLRMDEVYKVQETNRIASSFCI